MLTVAKLLIVAAVALYVPPGIEDPDIGRIYNGKIVGLVDPKRHQIIPQNYCRIDYLGHGLYMAWGKNAEDPFVYGRDRFLFNRNGLLIKTPMPPDSKLVQICWFGSQTDVNPDKILDCLPDDAILRFRKKGKFGLCDIRGNVLLEPSYDQIDTAREGICFAINRPAISGAKYNNRVFNCKTRALETEPYVAAKNVASGEGDKENNSMPPANLVVSYFYGDFAVAKPLTTGFTKEGVVNRKFEYVIRPRYQDVTPIFTKKTEGLLDSPTAKFRHSPDFFKVYEGHDEKLLSTSGAVLFVAPSGYMIDSVHGNTIYCHSPRKIIDNQPAFKQFSLVPEFLSALFNNDSRAPGLELQEEGPDRFLVERSADDGTFNQAYWINEESGCITRLEMFSRFLNKYDLIGMQRSQLKQLLLPKYLADQKANSYQISLDRGCGGAGCLIINMKNDKVLSFSINLNSWSRTADPSAEVITKNSRLLLKDPKHPDIWLAHMRFVPK